MRRKRFSHAGSLRGTPSLRAAPAGSASPASEVPTGFAPTGPGAGAGRRRSWLALAVKGTLLAIIWGVIAVVLIGAIFALDLPDLSQVTRYVRRPSVVLLAADGTPFHRLGETQGDLVDAADLPPPVVHAVLAIEDRRFFSHFGIDPIGFGRAMVANLMAGRTVQGGSTITQQLAKNLFLTPDRTFKRKIQEALLALSLEARYTKNQILSAYLNRVYLGAGTYGVEAAAQTYFGRAARDLSVMEAAILAGLLKAPSRYSPLSNPAGALERAKVVLAAMVDAGFLNPRVAAAAGRDTPRPRGQPGGSDGTGRYFADWVAEQVGGFVGTDYPDLVVRTTLDLPLQRAAERRVEALLAGPGVKAAASQAALVALGPEGGVRAMVGGRSYAASQFNRAAQALRQPGSAFKPIVYLAALESGMTPDTPVLDAPLRIGTWTPENFDSRYRGTIPLAEALAHSVNTCAVRLLDHVGVDRVRALAERLGITTPLSRDLALALGTGEVTLLDLAAVYAAFAHGGTPVLPYGIVEIRDRDGRVLYQRAGSGLGPATDPAAAGALVEMMEGVLTEGTGRSARLDRPAAGKTGTSQDFRDAWFLGFTADLVAGVWLGNDDNSAMRRVTGGGLPAQLWRDFMRDAHAGLPARPLLNPSALSAVPTAPTVAEPARGSATPEFGSLIDRLTGGGR